MTLLDTPVSETIEAYDQLIDDLARSVPGDATIEFAITPLDVTGIPVWSVTRWQPDGEMLNGIGYGFTDSRARVGSWAELLEQAGSHHAMARIERTWASYNELLKRGVAALNPLVLRLPAGSAYSHDQKLNWVPARRLDITRDDLAGEMILVPIEGAATHNFDCHLPADAAPLFQAISNGNGAGDTIERALTHGMLELVQRDGNSAGYRACDRGVRIDLGPDNQDVRHPQTRALLERLDAAGIDVIVKLADTNLGMTNLYVVGRERDLSLVPHPICLTGCGEAAHPDREQALLKALTEYCASRVRKLYMHGPIEAQRYLFPPGYLERFTASPASIEESRSFQAVAQWMQLSADEIVQRIGPTIFRVDRTVRFADLPTVDMDSLNEVGPLLRDVAARFTAEALDVFWVDYTPGDAPCRAAKVICAPLEVETMTYRRVGPRNLRRLIDRGFDFVGVGVAPNDTLRVPMLPEDEAALGGPAWLHPARADALLGPLYAMYREPDVHSIALSRPAEN